MTIKKSLLVSHIIAVILPIVLTLFVFCSALGGLYLYAQRGNHFMAESDVQFNVFANLIQNAIFHELRHERDPAAAEWLIRLVDPDETYVIVYRDGAPAYQYGSSILADRAALLRASDVQQEMDARPGGGTYSQTLAGQYSFLERGEIRGHVYHLYILAQKPVAKSDASIESAIHNLNRFILIALLFFIGLTSYLLVRFIIRRILRPLRELERGADEIRRGHLDVRLKSEQNDEFTPALDAFNVMTEKLAASLAARERDEERRKELIASISHDIRTPLTSIKAYVEGLLDHVASTPEQQERYLRVIEKKANVLERLIEQLFLLSKMDLGERALPLEWLDASQLTKSVLADGRESWERQGARLTLTAPDGLYFLGNALLYERILENLVTNSIRYKQAPLVHITLALKAQADTLTVTVTDDGPGVPEASLPRLLDAFYRTDKARSQTEKGSGLGLAIVKRAVRLMHGTIALKNATPHGLSVSLTFPLAGESAKEPSKP